MNTKNKNATPRISVIITCYNYGKFIDEAIESVQNQTFKDYEIIIIDDCSTDKFTKERLLEISQLNLPKEDNYEYSKVSSVILLKKNIGVCKARNVGAKLSKGKYIIFLDADDKLRDDCLKKMYKKIIEGYDLVGSGFQYFQNSNKIFKVKPYDKYKFCITSQITSSSLFKKSSFDYMGGFRKNMKDGMEDFDLWLGLIQENSSVFIIQESLLLYRDHGNTSRGGKLEQDRTKFRLMQGLLIKNNFKIFHWFFEEQRKRFKKSKKLTTKLKIILGLSLIINIIQILLRYY